MFYSKEEREWKAFSHIAELAVGLFYSYEYVAVMHAILTTPVQTDETGKLHRTRQLYTEVADRLQLNPMYVAKLLRQLCSKNLLDCISKKSVVTHLNDNNNGKDDYYGIDFEIMVRMLKIKLAAMEECLNSKENNDFPMLFCPSCRARGITTQRRLSVHSIDQDLLRCPMVAEGSECCDGVEMQEEVDFESQRYFAETRGKMKVELFELQSALREVDGMTPPSYVLLNTSKKRKNGGNMPREAQEETADCSKSSKNVDLGVPWLQGRGTQCNAFNCNMITESDKADDEKNEGWDEQTWGNFMKCAQEG